MDIKGKKLLILGANPETVPLVEFANDMGVYTIVTSFRSEDAAKKVACKSCEVDAADVDGLVKLANEEKIDGVLVGVADLLIPSYVKVCNALNLPCYATQSIVDVFSYKDRLKEAFEKYGIHGVPEYHLDEKMDPKDIEKIKYPVMVKPVDSCSGMGMTVCYSESELYPAARKALAASKQKRFIVERYMVGCGDVSIYYTFKDGFCSLSAILNRHTTDEQPGLSRVVLLTTYPSIHTDRYFERMHENACKLFTDIGISDGVLMLQAFVENGEFYIYDPGFRLTGEAVQLHMKAINGFDQREMLIRFALTGSGGDLDLKSVDDPYFKGKKAATLWLLAKKGKIEKITGLENVADDQRVAYLVQRFYDGDEIKDDFIGTEKQVVARLYIICDSKQELSEALKHYTDTIKVIDTDGNNMLLKGFDVDKALESVI